MRTLKLSVIVCISIITVIILGCSDESNPVANNPDPRIEGNSYYNPVLNFKISAPDGWTLLKDYEFGGHKLLLWGELNNSSSYNSNFNIVSVHTGSQENMSGFLPVAKQEINSMFDDVEFYSESIMEVSGLECLELVYKLNQNGADLIQKQVYFWSNKSLIVITFSTQSSFYVQVSDDFDSIQNSLKTIR
jgi:hypothetical protein